MNKLLLIAALAAGCATTTLRGTDACTTINDPDAPAGFTVYSCPHPFLVAHLDFNAAGAPGGLSTSKEAKGVTNCVDRTVKFWDTYPEILAHEYRHARACSTGGGND